MTDCFQVVAYEHFNLFQLADGIYAAITNDHHVAGSNAGIIDLGDRTIIFDTFLSPIAAAELVHAAETLTGRKPSMAVNSHMHSDHFLGNQLIPPQAPIFCTPEALAGMPDYAQNMQEMMDNPAELEEWILELEKDLPAIEAEDARQYAHGNILRYRHMLSFLPEFKLRLPDTTFSGSLLFHGCHCRAELRSSGHAHTSGDCYLILPEQNIIFMGDLGFFQRPPFMAHCDPQGWIDTLHDFESLSNTVFVPGHGPIGSTVEIQQQCQYMEILQHEVQHVVARGGGLENALQIPLSEPFNSWRRINPGSYEASVRCFLPTEA